MYSRLTKGSARVALAVVFAASAITAVPAYAHHEALFGPQSSAALSAPQFLSTQIFDTERGKGTDKTHATTTVFSGGVRPFRVPISISFVAPFSIETRPDGTTKRGMEDSLLAARYRWD